MAQILVLAICLAMSRSDILMFKSAKKSITNSPKQSALERKGWRRVRATREGEANVTTHTLLHINSLVVIAKSIEETDVKNDKVVFPKASQVLNGLPMHCINWHSGSNAIQNTVDP